MATHTLETTRSSPAALTEQGWGAGSENVGKSSTLVPVTAISQGRRREARTDHCQMCSYELLEAVKEETAVIRYGEATMLNQSVEGMLLLMDRAPDMHQLFEVRTSRSRWARTVYIFEARWVRLLQVEQRGALYLVGCERIFGPCHYVSF